MTLSYHREDPIQRSTPISTAEYAHEIVLMSYISWPICFVQYIYVYIYISFFLYVLSYIYAEGVVSRFHELGSHAIGPLAAGQARLPIYSRHLFVVTLSESRTRLA